ncbi:MAG: SPOR domain-containing protein [Saprospirales bacterium]|nr:SPOR domain-containing protein [Saprospirales bacterium]
MISLVCLSLLVAVGAVSAQKQLSKDEEKEWKKTAKEYMKNPAALAQLTKDKQELQRINNSMESDLNLLKTQVNAKDNRVASLESQIDQLSMQLEEARNAEPYQPAYTTPADSPGEMIPMGTIFRVQIGAFEKEKNQIPTGLETGQDMALEQAGGLQKIVLGQFTNKADAEKLQKHLKKIGVKDAWVVTYKDGVRQ